MGLLNDIMADDGEAFTDTDTFGESVTYTPLDGVPRTINAVVDRQMPDPVPGAPQARTPIIRVSIRNHVTLGASSINKGGDTVTVAARYGGTPQVFLIADVESQDGGMWRLLLR